MKIELSKEDKLRLELITVKAQNLQLELQHLHAQSTEFAKRKEELTVEMAELKGHFLSKYSVDLGQQTVHSDGTVSPLPHGQTQVASSAHAPQPVPPGVPGGLPNL